MVMRNVIWLGFYTGCPSCRNSPHLWELSLALCIASQTPRIWCAKWDVKWLEFAAMLSVLGINVYFVFRIYLACSPLCQYHWQVAALAIDRSVDDSCESELDSDGVVFVTLWQGITPSMAHCLTKSAKWGLWMRAMLYAIKAFISCQEMINVILSQVVGMSLSKRFSAPPVPIQYPQYP